MTADHPFVRSERAIRESDLLSAERLRVRHQFSDRLKQRRLAALAMTLQAMRAKSELFVANIALEEALVITRQMQGNVQFVEWRAGYLEIVAHRGFSTEFLTTFQRVRSSDGCACGRALLQRRTVLVHDVYYDKRFPALRAVGQEAGFISVQSTPLISSNGALLGIISTHGTCGPTDEQLEQIKTLAQRTANELVRLRARNILISRP